MAGAGSKLRKKNIKSKRKVPPGARRGGTVDKGLEKGLPGKLPGTKDKMRPDSLTTDPKRKRKKRKA